MALCSEHGRLHQTCGVTHAVGHHAAFPVVCKNPNGRQSGCIPEVVAEPCATGGALGTAGRIMYRQSRSSFDQQQLSALRDAKGDPCGGRSSGPNRQRRGTGPAAPLWLSGWLSRRHALLTPVRSAGEPLGKPSEQRSHPVAASSTVVTLTVPGSGWTATPPACSPRARA
jgi:hypothetical protein